jgi:hypothetical protein
MMDEFIVTSKKQLIAAINSAAQPTHEAASANGFHVCLGTTRYRFPKGVTQRRAKVIAKNIESMPKSYFNVEELLWTT